MDAIPAGELILIRIANIEPLVNVALALYHALNRRQPDALFSLPDFRQRIDAHPEADHLFIVLGSPVTEVGLYHDWAVVEPQLAPLEKPRPRQTRL